MVRLFTFAALFGITVRRVAAKDSGWVAAAVGVSTSGKLVQVGSLSVVGVVIQAASVAW